MAGMDRRLTDIQIDRQRERKFRSDIKDRLVASGLSCLITTDGVMVRYPNGEQCLLWIENRTGTGWQGS